MSFIRPSEPLQAALPLLISFSSDRAATLAARPPVPYTHLAAYEALLFVPFLVPPFPGRRALFLGLQTSLLLYLLRCTLGSPSVDYAYGVALYGQMQRFCDFYGCAGTPETNSDLIPKGQAGAFGDLRWWQKLHAVEGVYRNTRGIGWRWELRRRPMRTPLDRWRFVSRNFLWGMFLLAVSMPAQRMYAPAERLLGGIPVWERVLRSHAGIFGVFAFLDGVYAFSAAATVAAGVSRPTDWPPAFGELKECWSIRRTWGWVVLL